MSRWPEAGKPGETGAAAFYRMRTGARRRGTAGVLRIAAVAILVMVAAAAALASRPGPQQLEAVALRPEFVSPYPPARLAAGLGAVLGAVWLTYGYVVYQLWRIARP